MVCAEDLPFAWPTGSFVPKEKRLVGPAGDRASEKLSDKAGWLLNSRPWKMCVFFMNFLNSYTRFLSQASTFLSQFGNLFIRKTFRKVCPNGDASSGVIATYRAGSSATERRQQKVC